MRSKTKQKTTTTAYFVWVYRFFINFSAVFAKLLFSKLLNLQALKDEQAIGWTSEFRFEIISGYIELDVFLYNWREHKQTKNKWCQFRHVDAIYFSQLIQMLYYFIACVSMCACMRLCELMKRIARNLTEISGSWVSLLFLCWNIRLEAMDS